LLKHKTGLESISLRNTEVAAIESDRKSLLNGKDEAKCQKSQIS
jgi:hypothetical protein